MQTTGVSANTPASMAPSAPQRIGVPREIFPGEKRVATVPDAVVKLVAASKSNTMDTLKPAFGAVGKTCKGCHDDFRNQ